MREGISPKSVPSPLAWLLCAPMRDRQAMFQASVGDHAGDWVAGDPARVHCAQPHRRRRTTRAASYALTRASAQQV